MAIGSRFLSVIRSRSSKRTKSPKSTSITQLSDYAQRLAASGTDPGPVITGSYIAELKNAEKQQGRWRRIYYQWRGFVIVASAAITALTALNLHGGAAFALRVLTLILSTLVTVFTGLLELLQVNHRWSLYRQLRGTLENLGWQTATKDGGQAASLVALGNGLISAMRDFERGYLSQIEGAGNQSANSDTSNQDLKPAKSSETEASGSTSATNH